jgi:hypothetical protein
MAALRFRQPDYYFMKPYDFEEISVSKILQIAQGAGLLGA